MNRYRRLVGLKVYTTEAALVGTVRDVGLYAGNNEPGVYLVVEAPRGRVGIPLSSVEAVGDIVLVRSGYETVEAGGDTGSGGVAAQKSPLPAGGGGGGAAAPAPAAVGPVIPRCPRCGAAVIYDPRKRRWYCPSCRRYVRLGRSVEARVPRCPACGLPLSYIERYGRWYCYNCRRYVEPG